MCRRYHRPGGFLPFISDILEICWQAAFGQGVVCAMVEVLGIDGI